MTQPKRLRVLLTADAVGGVWTYAMDLSSGLVDQGADVTVALLGPRLSQAQQRAAADRRITVVETDLPLDWLAADADQLSAAGRRLAALAERRQIDLVHLNSPPLAADAHFSMPVVGGCHSCVASWWSAVRGGPLPEDFRWRTAVLERGYRACTALIAPSDWFLKETLACYGAAPTLVRHGRHTGDRRFDPSLKRPSVLTSGRLWDPAKNILGLDAACLQMKGAVVAAGPVAGPHGETVELKAVVPLGVLDEKSMTTQLNQATVFCSLALYEPFGLGVLEAAQAGCALVLSDIPTFRELWSEAAVFVAPENPGRTAAVLDGLLDHPAEAQRLGRLASVRARSFTVEAMAARTFDVYRRTLTQGVSQVSAA